MKKLLWPLMACLVVSCGKNNQTKKPIEFMNELNSIEQMDKDNDGISDKEEKQLGTDPLIADFPQLNIDLTSDISLKNKYFNNTNTYNNTLGFTRNPKAKILEVRKHASKLAFAQMKNLEEDFPYLDFKDYLKNQVRCMSRFEYMRKFNQVVKNYNSLHFDHHFLDFYFTLKYETSIKNIQIEKPSFSLYLNKKHLKDFKTLQKHHAFNKFRGKLIEREKQDFIIESPIELESFNADENCFHIGTNDFSYKVNETNFSYKKTIENLSDKNATVIILKKGMLKQFSISAQELDMKGLLEKIGAKPEFNSDGELLKAYGVVNEFKDFNEFDINQHKNLSKRRWFFLNSNQSQFFEKLKNGKVYILAHLSLEEILEDAHYKKQLKGQLDSHYRLRLTNLYVGDDITLEVKTTGTLKIHGPRSYYRDGLWFGKTFPRRKKNKCYIIETNIYDQTPLRSTYTKLEKNKIFYVKTSSKILRPKVLKDKLIYEFRITKADLKKGFIEIKFPKETPESYGYLRNINIKLKKKTVNCYDLPYGKVEGHKSYRHRFKARKQLDYDIQIVHRGIKR